MKRLIKPFKLISKRSISIWGFNMWVKIKRGASRIIQPMSLALIAGLVASVFLMLASGSWLMFALPIEASFFFTSAGLVGGALAIVVTLNILLLQNSLEKLPARIYQKSTDHKGLNLIYFLLTAITIGLFMMGISYVDPSLQPRGLLLRLGLIADTWAFVLIFIYLRLVIMRLDPRRQITSLAMGIRSEIDETEKLIKRYTKLMAGDPQDTVATEAYIRTQLQPRTESIYSDFQDLAGLYTRLYERGDKELALSCLRTITSSVYYLYTKRKDSAIALPTEYLLTPKSDLSDFALKIDEILLPIWTRALKNSDVDTIRELMRGYQLMVTASASVRHRNYQRENPLIAYTFGGLKKIINLAIQYKNQEAIFQSAEVLKGIAIQISAQTKNDRFAHVHFNDAYKLLNQIFLYGLVSNDTAVAKEGLSTSVAIFSSVVQQAIKDEELNKAAVEQFATTLKAVNAPANRSLLTIGGSEIAAEEHLIRLLLGPITDNPSRAAIRKMSAGTALILDALLKSLDTPLKTTLNIDLERYYELSGEAAIEILNKHTRTLTEKDQERLQKIIDTLITIHNTTLRVFNYGDRAEGQSETYSEKLTIIGIDAAALGDTKNATLIIDALMDSAEWLMGQTSDINWIEHVASRTATNAGLIAAVCHAKRQYAVSRHYKERMNAFEDLWVRTLFPNGFSAGVSYAPSPMRARYGLASIVSDLNSGYRMPPELTQSPVGRLTQEISGDQLEMFESYVWRDKQPPQPNP